jgi:hypothetical protein
MNTNSGISRQGAKAQRRTNSEGAKTRRSNFRFQLFSFSAFQLVLLLAFQFFASGADLGGVTQRYHNSARITVDPTVTIADEDAGWTLTAAQLGKLAVLQSGAASNDYWIVATITLTNAGGTSNGMTLTVNGDVRTWTNATTASTIATNDSFYGSATNLYLAVTTNGFTGLTLAMSSTNGITLTGLTNSAVTVSVSTNWATVTLATNRSFTLTATFSPAYSAAPVVIAIGQTNDLPHIIGITTTNAVIGTGATNGYYRWLSFGSP